MVDWSTVRAEFPALSGLTFLNTATYGQLPQRAVQAAMAHFERRDEHACADFLEWFDDMDDLRASVARLINAEPSDIAFANNAATALSWLLLGLEWKPGDQIITLQHEFPNNLYFPAMLGARGVEVIETGFDRLRDAVTERTRLVMLSTVNYMTGLRPPLAGLAAWLRSRGVLLYLDGTQSLGALRFDVQQVQPDMFAVHGYKWLLSPNGAAFAYLSPALRQQLSPTVIGWRSDRSWREVDQLHHGAPRLCEDAQRYEGGMLNFPSLYAMHASVNMMLELGPDVIEARVLDLAAKCRQMLTGLGASIAHPESIILAARFDGIDASALAKRLREQGILVSARQGYLRVSVHFYNNEEDIERLGIALVSCTAAGQIY
jgi:selenocysteine lyase/cysteine desulfurase